jgi:hypothetical protein
MELNLSKEESLQLLNLRKENVISLCLDKPTIANQVSRVAVVMDYSGSMSSLYQNGTVQAIIERLLPIAMKFDDNGEMEMWIFENGYRRLPNINLNNYYGYVQREILDKKYRMGGTEYAPVMVDVFNKYMHEEVSNIPNYVLFITDGENCDKTKSTNIIKKVSKYPIFWQFIGIGDERFSFLQGLDDLEGRYVDNANFFALNDFQNITDDELYKRLLNEYPMWLENPIVKTMDYSSEEINVNTNDNSSSSSNTNQKKKGFFSKIFG